MTYPVANFQGREAVISQEFKPGKHLGVDIDFRNEGSWPPGTDISKNRGFAGPPGVAVVAWRPGYVVFADWRSNGGRVRLEHANGFITEYRHLASLAVKPGMFVDEGQELGEMGRGAKSIRHLHFFLRIGSGEWIDPEPFLVGEYHIDLEPMSASRSSEMRAVELGPIGWGPFFGIVTAAIAVIAVLAAMGRSDTDSP